MRFGRISILATGMLIAVSNASADVITPVSATSPPGQFGSDITHTFDSSGLSEGPILSAIHAETVPANCFMRVNYYEGDPYAAEFDLGQIHLVDGLAFWNLNIGPDEFGNSGLKDVELFSSTDGTTYTPIPGAPTFFEAEFGTTSSPQIFSWEAVEASHIRLVAYTNHGDILEGRGFAEIRFLGVVPEPSAAAAALCLVALGLRRRPVA